MKKIVTAVAATAMLVASSVCAFGANDTSNVGMETKLYAQYMETGDTYTVRFIADVAYDAVDEQYAEYKQFGFWCSNSSYFSGDNYMGTSIYKTIKANGQDVIAENGYFVVFEITGVTADANLYVDPVCKDSAGAVTSVGEKVNVTMSYIIENAAEEESTSGGNGSGEDETEDNEVITDGMSLQYECYDATQKCAVVSGSLASGNVTIPSTYTNGEVTYTVAAIEQEAFLQNTSLVSMILPGTIQYIGDNAFMNCYSLTSMTIASGTTSIGTKAFYCCSSLQELTIPATVTTFGTDVFGNCTNLTTIYVENESSKSKVESALSASGVSCSVVIK